MGRKPWYLETLYKGSKRRTSVIQKLKRQIREKHRQSTGGFKEMIGGEEDIECLLRRNIDAPGYDRNIIMRILMRYATSSQRLPAIEEDYDRFTISFCDIYDMPDCDSSKAFFLEIRDSKYELLNRGKYYYYDPHDGVNYFNRKYFWASDIGRNMEEELQSLYNDKIDKRLRGHARRSRDTRLRKFSAIISEVKIVYF